MKWKTAKPLEHEIQSAYFDLVEREAARDFRWATIHAVPNGRKASMGTKLWNWREGLRSGVPDVHIPVPTANRPGAWIEFKRPGEKLKEKQEYWKKLLERFGHIVTVQTDAVEAFAWTQRYMRGEL